MIEFKDDVQMNVLLLGPEREWLVKYLESFGDRVFQYQDKLNEESPILKDKDFIISYGYRYIIQTTIIQKFSGKAINLHISYLPWNKGADPNLWSFLEDTPKGVTIHYLDSGLDTGDIIVQKEISYDKNDTLKTTYDKLTNTIEGLLTDYWPIIREGKIEAKSQTSSGSYHKLADKEKYSHLLKQGWDTPVINLIGKAKQKD